MFIASIVTEGGIFTAHFSPRGLARLEFPPTQLRENASVPTDISAQHRELLRWIKLTEAALKSVLAGRSPRSLPPLDLTMGTDFQQRVWHALLAIAPGQTRSYSELAGLLGHPKAARAVGGACGANPIPLLIPCHRVLAANRQLGGFSGGLEWKRRLLRGENCTVIEP